MSPLRKGLFLAALQILVVLSLAGKLLYDRHARPRVWVLSEVFDPELPIRGRYLAQRLRFPAEGFSYQEPDKRNYGNWFINRQWAYLQFRDNHLVAESEGSGPGEWVYLRKNSDGTLMAVSEDPVLIFIPDTAEIPTLKPGQEIWTEVTLPVKGPPRPIRIAIKKDGVLAPLQWN
jgi:hypothetical protein